MKWYISLIVAVVIFAFAWPVIKDILGKNKGQPTQTNRQPKQKKDVVCHL